MRISDWSSDVCSSDLVADGDQRYLVPGDQRSQRIDAAFATAGAISAFAEYLVGKDPRLIEHHWQYMYRWTHFRGSAVMAALSAVDKIERASCRERGCQSV